MKLSRDDVERLKPHLSGWNHLNEVMMLANLCPNDLKKLIALECLGACRRQILDKLTARLYTTMKRETVESLNVWISKKNRLNKSSSAGARRTASSSTSFPVPLIEAFRIELPSLQEERLDSLSSKEVGTAPPCSKQGKFSD